MTKQNLRCLLAVLFAAPLGCGRESPLADPEVRALVAPESLVFVSASYDQERKRLRVEVRNEGERLISLVSYALMVTRLDLAKSFHSSVPLGVGEDSPALLFHGDRGDFIYDVDRHKTSQHSGVFLAPKCWMNIHMKLDPSFGWPDAPKSFRIETKVYVGLMHWPDGSFEAQESAKHFRVYAEPFVVNLAPIADAVEP